MSAASSARRRGRLAKAGRAFVKVVAEREGAETQALFRIAVGLVLLVALVTMNRAWSVVWVDASHGGIVTLGHPSWLVRLLGGPTPQVVRRLMTAAIVAAAFVTVGLGGRAATLIAGQLYLALFTLNGNASAGYDLLFTNALWLLTLGAPTEVWSLDAWLARRRGRRPKRALAWPRRVAVLQIVVVYFSTGLQKLSPVWTPAGGYSALYWVFQEPTWRRFDMTWTAEAYPFTEVATFVTWHFEVLSPLLLLALWYRRTRERPGRLRRLANRFDARKAFVAIGIALHVGILSLLDVGPFSLISVAYYICLLRPEEARRLVERPTRKTRVSRVADAAQAGTAGAGKAPPEAA